MRNGYLVIAFVLSFLTAGSAMAQNVWVQIEAHPSRADAEASANGYGLDIGPLQGYRLRSGWYALAIGPLAPSEAPTVLRQLRVTRQIPGDSYLVDGTTFREQFWPPAGSPQAAAQPTITLPDPPEPGEETLAEARRSENLLTREERMELQTALAWQGHYTSAIDGSIGRGSRNAMAAWQAANGYEATGTMTTLQRRELVSAYRDVLAQIGMTPYVDTVAGIEIDLPLAMVEKDRYDPPFVHFNAKGDTRVQAVLISQRGGRDALGALYEVLQTLEIVPLDGDRRLTRNRFEISGANGDVLTDIHAEIAGDDIKGYMLVWPASGDLEQRDMVLARMAQSFRPVVGTVLPEDFGAPSRQSVDLLSGLAIRRPEFTRTGFYVSADGAVLTSTGGVAICNRITLGPDDIPTEIRATDEATGLALLRPTVALAPLATAAFDAEMPRIGDEIAVSGYSYGGRLMAPSLTFGTLEDVTGLNAEPEFRRLSLPAEAGDVGGPVVGSSGAVLGMLMPHEQGARILPDGVHLAVGAEPLAAFLNQNGINPRTPELLASRAPEDLAAIAGDMTVLVNCWN